MAVSALVVSFWACLKASERFENNESDKKKSFASLTLELFVVPSGLMVEGGTGGLGAFFFFLRNDMPSLDDASDDVDPLKLWPGEL